MSGNEESSGAQRRSMIAYEVLLHKILTGELAAGSVIQERRLTAEIGVSRTPVRDALIMLENEGLLVRSAPRTLQVKHMDTRDYLDNIQIRQMLEPEAARLAATRLDLADIEAIGIRIRALIDAPGEPARTELRATDEALHKMIAMGSGNPQIWRIIQGLRLQTQIFDLKSLPNRRAATFEEHLRILEALKARDPEAARAATNTHLANVRQSILDHLTGASQR
ncbi:GntR family transcriptional regulator [Poseidonocella sp. HB161398]|uniref:GntR family transcriptional regulator n=1 Tax=Poseidonocella sp. HB161398 TaxID=2320855 RepID=UPI001108D6BA|nr:GntR family transcriptional regulator [Poseidonocella sp. HB161398]